MNPLDNHITIPTLPIFIDKNKIYSVEKLNNAINLELQQSFGIVYVEGEISNLAKPASGHLYFTLKDQNSQIKCALFKGYRKFIQTKLDNGQKVLVKANISIYVPRGDYQLIVEHVYPTGLGALQQAFETLKKKLKEEGLFEPKYKKEIPKLPNQIFIVTSPTGAAVRDIITTLNRRFPSIPLKIIPSLVQGATASASLIKAIQIADNLADNQHDIIIVARGGGSLEDLWAFNDENLARTIFQAKTPIITGIGHEIDFTIADFVADLRAATPTAAAENASPNWQDYTAEIIKIQQNLYKIFTNKLFYAKQRVKHINHRLLQQHPKTKLNNQSQLLDELAAKLFYAWDKKYNFLSNNLKIINHRLAKHNPNYSIMLQENNINNYKKLLNNHLLNSLKHKQILIKNLSARLNSVNPLDILARGYSFLTKPDGQIITMQAQVTKGDKIKAKLYEGEIECEVV